MMNYSGVISNAASIIKAKSVEIGRLATLIVFGDLSLGEHCLFLHAS